MRRINREGALQGTAQLQRVRDLPYTHAALRAQLNWLFAGREFSRIFAEAAGAARR